MLHSVMPNTGLRHSTRQISSVLNISWSCKNQVGANDKLPDYATLLARYFREHAGEPDYLAEYLGNVLNCKITDPFKRFRCHAKHALTCIILALKEQISRIGHGMVTIFTIKLCSGSPRIGKELSDPATVPENAYNMDETGVLLSVLSSLKVLVSKQDLRNYRKVMSVKILGGELFSAFSEPDRAVMCKSVCVILGLIPSFFSMRCESPLRGV